MEEKKQTMYEISKDLLSLQDLLDNCVDDDGNPREPTEEEMETMKQWFNLSAADFQKKFDNYCRFIKNLKMEAEIIDNERKTYKAELDRLSARAKTANNKAKCIQSLLQYNMDIIHTKKFKSSFFTAGIQKSQISIEPLAGSSLKNVPEDYLKPRELDTTAIKQGIKSGALELREDDENPLNRSKIFDVKTGKELPDIRWHKNEILVIR